MDLIKKTSKNYSKQKDSKAFEKAGRVIAKSLQTSYTAFRENIHSQTGITQKNRKKQN